MFDKLKNLKPTNAAKAGMAVHNFAAAKVKKTMAGARKEAKRRLL